MDSRQHSIQFLINNLLNEDWDVEAGVEVPLLDEETDCVVFMFLSSFDLLFFLKIAIDGAMQECYNWQFGFFK